MFQFLRALTFEFHGQSTEGANSIVHCNSGFSHQNLRHLFDHCADETFDFQNRQMHSNAHVDGNRPIDTAVYAA